MLFKLVSLCDNIFGIIYIVPDIHDLIFIISLCKTLFQNVNTSLKCYRMEYGRTKSKVNISSM